MTDDDQFERSLEEIRAVSAANHAEEMEQLEKLRIASEQELARFKAKLEELQQRYYLDPEFHALVHRAHVLTAHAVPMIGDEHLAGVFAAIAVLQANDRMPEPVRERGKGVLVGAILAWASPYHMNLRDDPNYGVYERTTYDATPWKRVEP
jgi:hypothetical protein